MITEGLDVFSQKTPKSLAGVSVRDSKIRDKTGCSIVAIKGDAETPKSLAGVSVRDSKIRDKTGCSIVAIKGDAGTIITPSPKDEFCKNGEIILIGSEAAEKAFESKFCS